MPRWCSATLRRKDLPKLEPTRRFGLMRELPQTRMSKMRGALETLGDTMAWRHQIRVPRVRVFPCAVPSTPCVGFSVCARKGMPLFPERLGLQCGGAGTRLRGGLR
jgi:hypothetical protein